MKLYDDEEKMRKIVLALRWLLNHLESTEYYIL